MTGQFLLLYFTLTPLLPASRHNTTQHFVTCQLPQCVTIVNRYRYRLCRIGFGIDEADISPPTVRFPRFTASIGSSSMTSSQKYNSKGASLLRNTCAAFPEARSILRCASSIAFTSIILRKLVALSPGYNETPHHEAHGCLIMTPPLMICRYSPHKVVLTPAGHIACFRRQRYSFRCISFISTGFGTSCRYELHQYFSLPLRPKRFAAPGAWKSF